MRKKQKHWFDRLPKIYQEFVLSEQKRMGRISIDPYEFPRLSCFFIWPDNTCFLLEAIHCELENLNEFIVR